MSVSAESALIAACLCDSLAIVETLGILKPSHFESIQNGLIWDSIQDLTKEGSAVDEITIVEDLRRRGKLERVGGASYISSLSDFLPDPQSAKSYAKAILENSNLRKLKQLSKTLAMATDVKSATDASYAALMKLDSAHKDSTRTSKDIVEKSVKRIIDQAEGKAPPPGIITGFPMADNMLVSMPPGTYNVLAARPSAGKTALAMKIAHHAAAVQKKGVLVISLETAGELLMDRMISDISGIPYMNIRTGNINNSGHRGSLSSAAEHISRLNMNIDDNSTLTVQQIRSIIQKKQLQSNVDFVIIDYMQLITPSSSSKTRNEDVAQISRDLKKLGRDLGVTLLLLSQLNRNSENEKRRPRKSDLSESGKIEMDADVIMFIIRDQIETPTIAELDIAKNKNGPIGAVPLMFQEDYCRFVQGSWAEHMVIRG